MRLRASCKTVKYTRNQVVYREGDLADNIYIVKEGQFSLNKNVMKRKICDEEKRLLE